MINRGDIYSRVIILRADYSLLKIHIYHINRKKLKNIKKTKTGFI